MHRRFILMNSDILEAAKKHDEIYSHLDSLLSNEMLSKVHLEDKIDIKFFLDEIADNFLVHDKDFRNANIDIWIDKLDVKIQISHDGNDFDPLDDDSPCENIKRAAERLNISSPSTRLGMSIRRKTVLKFTLREY